MCVQLELFGSDKQPPHTYSVFLALFPKQAAASHIAKHAPSIREHHGLTGRLRPLDHLHISLHWLGDFPEVPQSVSPAIAQACQRIADQTSPLEIQLDRISSYRGRPGNHPLVLRGNDDTTSTLIQFQQKLVVELRKAGPPSTGGRSSKFDPHLTLLYDKQRIEESLITPMSWTAKEVVLVCSEVGATRYHRLAEWKFCSL